MKCKACDVPLNDFESTRKYEWGEFVDLCNYCYSYAKVTSYDRYDLASEDDLSESNEQHNDEDYDIDNIKSNASYTLSGVRKTGEGSDG